MTARRRMSTSSPASNCRHRSHPGLQPVYDDTEFLVRNVIRFYGGWWSGPPPANSSPPRAPAPGERDGRSRRRAP
ncbi:MAG: hypothetical protein WDM81_16335 [Rhizomicrobium sp.]